MRTKFSVRLKYVALLLFLEYSVIENRRSNDIDRYNSCRHNKEANG